MSELAVSLYGTRIGALVGRGRDFDFVITPEAIERFGLDSQILSLAIPLAPRAPRGRKARRQNFFSELLPEGMMRQRLADEAGVSAADVIGLLRRYGRDVAGALEIWDPTAPGEPPTPGLEPLDDAGVARALRDVARFPLANKPMGGKTSLNGVQDKIVLVHDQRSGAWARALDGYPSTHILKPVPADHPTIIFDEEYGSRFARALGLASFTTEIREFDGVSALVIERYDRVSSSNGVPVRLHQEDFNQVLGASGDQKYQRYGGHVSLSRIAKELAQAGAVEAVRRLALTTVLAVAVGNLDMHAKNISLLHPAGGVLRLADAYDVVPQVHLPNDGEMALAVDGVYRHAAIARASLEREFESWGVPAADVLVTAALETVLGVAQGEQPDERAHPSLREDILMFADNLLVGRPAGAR
ncbi:MAG: HipA domain-containing protein [Promicromonosporaceae bacterium]|nr:HipA domain-containing protein [Promicromonosporaceae bacterium]